MDPGLLKAVTRTQMLAVVVTSAAALFFWPKGAAGVLAGGLLMAANFWLLRTLVARMFQSTGFAATASGVSVPPVNDPLTTCEAIPAPAPSAPRTGATLGYGLLLAVKFAVVLGAMTFAVMVLEIDPLGLAVGMATLFAGVLGGMLQHNSARTPRGGGGTLGGVPT